MQAHPGILEEPQRVIPFSRHRRIQETLFRWIRAHRIQEVLLRQIRVPVKELLRRPRTRGSRALSRRKAGGLRKRPIPVRDRILPEKEKRMQKAQEHRKAMQTKQQSRRQLRRHIITGGRRAIPAAG